MDRNCDKCIHHTSGMCDSWDCKMQTVEDVKKEAREKAIEEFAEQIKEEIANCSWQFSRLEAETIDKIAISIVRGKE